MTSPLVTRGLADDDEVAQTWAKLRVMLRDSGQHMPVNDSWIAATAWSRRLPLVTQDHDYVDIPGLDVITV